MNELATLIQEWLATEGKNWWVTHYMDLSDLLLYGKKPTKYVGVVFEDRVMLNDYVLPYKLISPEKQIIYATDPKFFEKLRSAMIVVEEATNGH